MKKLLLLASFFVLIPSFASAQADSSLTNQVQKLQARVANLEAQLANPEPLCRALNATLSRGNKGVEVAALQRFLQAERFAIASDELKKSFFGVTTEIAVHGFQERFALYILAAVHLKKGNGIVGPATRRVLVGLYGCPTFQTGKTISISTASVLAGTKRIPFLGVFKAKGGNPIYSWNVTSGALPPGLVLASAGFLPGDCNERGCQTQERQKTSVWLQGIPSQPGTFIFTLATTDRDGVSDSASFTMIVAPQRAQ